MVQANQHTAAGDEIGRAQGTSGLKTWFLGVTFLVVALLAYQPAWHAGFIWDDDDHLTANPAMTAPDGLRMIWSSMPVSRYYPLTLTSFWVQRRLWGLDPMPYHLVNIALHAINALLVFLVLRRLRVAGALLAALVWLLHPVNVESVAWVTELKNTQSGLFFFAAILCFLHSGVTVEKPDISVDNSATALRSPDLGIGVKSVATTLGWYVLALLSGAAAMLSKPSTVILPLTLLLCVWWERKRWQRADMVRISPFFFLALGMSVLAVLEQRWQIARSGPAVWKAGVAQRLIGAGKAIWFYAAKLVWPAPLVFVYPRWTLDATSFLPWTPLLGLVAVGIVVWVCRRRPWDRAAIFGVGYFVMALLPVLGFFDIYYFHFSFVADHFQYLASVGLIALATSAATSLGSPGDSGIRRLQPAPLARTLKGAATWLPLVAVTLLLTLGALTWSQSRVYHDAETLWSDTLAKNPACWMADHNLANLFLQSGDTRAAIAHWEHALQTNPDLPEVYNNLGTTLFKVGRVREAIGRWEQALHTDPDYFGAHLNLGVALVQQGRVSDGIGHLQQALRIIPDSFEARIDLAAAFVRLGRGQEAIPQLEQAVRIKPDSVPAQSRLAWLLATLPQTEGGDAARAVVLAQRACELTGNRVAVNLDLLAVAYGAAGRFDDAVATAQKAVDLARASSEPKLAEEIESRLELYRSGRAYRPSIRPAPLTAVTSPRNP